MRGRAAFQEVGREGTAQLGHYRGGPGTVSDDVADRDGDVIVVKDGDVVPVPAGRGVSPRGKVVGGQRETRNVGQARR